MCGINGIVTKNFQGRQEAVQRMNNAIKHRGPDDHGIYGFENCVLGHRRLSIIDLKHGQQPMITDNKSVGLVFNGEIYGYKTIKKSISYSYKTTSDTELLIALYQEYQTDLINHLPGMFAFALWDENKQLLFAARDRFGEKPFYYAYTDTGLIFSSEIKGILASGLIEPKIDPIAISFYLHHLYIHPNHTIYKNIFTLPPAHRLIYQEGKTTVEKYWSLPDKTIDITLEEAVEEFQLLFNQSIKNQLVADVPVGCFLSGGIDSGSVVSIASLYCNQISTFSFGFTDGNNELNEANKIAQQFGTNHHSFEDSDYEIADLLIEMQSIYDEPFADSSNIPTYLIAKHASRYLKVVLTGDGGDELFAGYDFWYHKLLNKKPLFQDRGIWRQYYLKNLQRAIPILPHSLVQYYQQELNEYASWSLGKWISSEHKNSNVFIALPQIKRLDLPEIPLNWYHLENYTSNTLDDALKMDLQNYMPGDILVKTDRASMANSLELRAPFLDQSLAEFCISLPWNLKISPSTSKILLKKAMREKLPESHLNQEKKGFGAPVNEWLKAKYVRELVNDLELRRQDLKIGNHININSDTFSLRSFDYKSWILLNLTLWAEKWL